MTCPQPPGSKGNTGSGQRRPRLGGLVRLESPGGRALPPPVQTPTPVRACNSQPRTTLQGLWPPLRSLTIISRCHRAWTAAAPGLGTSLFL